MAFSISHQNDSKSALHNVIAFAVLGVNPCLGLLCVTPVREISVRLTPMYLMLAGLAACNGDHPPPEELDNPSSCLSWRALLRERSLRLLALSTLIRLALSVSIQMLRFQRRQAR